MTIVYAQERLVDIQAEVAELGHQQTAEMAVGFEKFVEQPNWPWYLGLEAKGMLILLTARQEAGELAGYFGAYVYRSTTSQHRMVQATPYYVIPCRFRAIILKRLFQNLLAHPLTAGALVTIKTHVWADAGPILRHLGFRAAETWYMLEAPIPAGEPPDA